ncbi:MAG: hypothetical protein ACREL9_08310 [Gemmatimonadales bacterium]
MSLRSLLSFRVALGIGLAIHIDWHLARPVHERLSFGWPGHWLLALPVFLAAGWYLTRGWPTAPARPAALSVGLGVVLGQVLEPLGEVLVYHATLAEVFEPTRLRAFAVFLAAGLVALALALAARRAGRRPLHPWR